jgi:hypothetical protein
MAIEEELFESVTEHDVLALLGHSEKITGMIADDAWALVVASLGLEAGFKGHRREVRC